MRKKKRNCLAGLGQFDMFGDMGLAQSTAAAAQSAGLIKQEDLTIGNTGFDASMSMILTDPGTMQRENSLLSVFGTGTSGATLENSLWKASGQQDKNAIANTLLQSLTPVIGGVLGKALGIPSLPVDNLTDTREAEKAARDAALQQQLRALEAAKQQVLLQAQSVRGQAAELARAQAELQQLRLAQRALQDRKTSTINEKEWWMNMLKKGLLYGGLATAGGLFVVYGLPLLRGR